MGPMPSTPSSASRRAAAAPYERRVVPYDVEQRKAIMKAPVWEFCYENGDWIVVNSNTKEKGNGNGSFRVRSVDVESATDFLRPKPPSNIIQMNAYDNSEIGMFLRYIVYLKFVPAKDGPLGKIESLIALYNMLEKYKCDKHLILLDDQVPNLVSTVDDKRGMFKLACLNRWERLAQLTLQAIGSVDGAALLNGDATGWKPAGDVLTVLMKASGSVGLADGDIDWKGIGKIFKFEPKANAGVAL